MTFRLVGPKIAVILYSKSLTFSFVRMKRAITKKGVIVGREPNMYAFCWKRSLLLAKQYKRYCSAEG